MVCAVGLLFPLFGCVFCFFTSTSGLCNKEGMRAMLFGGAGEGGDR